MAGDPVGAEEMTNATAWENAAKRFELAVAHHMVTRCDRDVDLVGSNICCIVAGLVAASPYMGHDPTVGIVFAYEIGVKEGVTDLAMLVRSLHQEAISHPGWCNHCRFRWPCPTIQLTDPDDSDVRDLMRAQARSLRELLTGPNAKEET